MTTTEPTTKYPRIVELVHGYRDVDPAVLRKATEGYYDKSIAEHLEFATESEVAHSIVEFNGI